MSIFTIDFFELAFLAEACIPPTPIARGVFWKNLTDKYWHQMTEGERKRLFEWLNKNPWYQESLEKEEDTKVFHARFDSDNQYLVKTNCKGIKEEYRAFKLGDRYYVGQNMLIEPDWIIEVEKFIVKPEEY